MLSANHNDRPLPSLAEVTLKAAIVHTATYFIMGLMALYTFNYAELFSSGALSDYMRDVDDPLVMAGPLFQPLRGALFGLCFFAIREVVFTRQNGWLTMWLLLAVLGILNPFAAATGSIEGAIYSTLPFSAHFSISMIEVYGQSLLLSLGLFYWVRNSNKRWLTWGLSIIAAAALLLPLAGLFLAPMAS